MGLFRKRFLPAQTISAAYDIGWQPGNSLSFFELEQRTVFDGAIAATISDAYTDQADGTQAAATPTGPGVEISNTTDSLIEALGYISNPEEQAH